MPTFEDIKRSEKKKALKVLKGSRDPKKVKRVLSGFYESLDANMKYVVNSNNISLECGEGCSSCCYLKVDARAHEVFLIADYVKENFSNEDIEALKIRLEENSRVIFPLTREEHWVTNIQCALLKNDRCSVYSVRPALCRKYHSISAELCRQSYERPEDPSIPSSENELLDFSARGAILGFGDAIRKVKLDSEVYDINSALLHALNEPNRESEWRRGKKAFPGSAESKNDL